MDFIETLFGVSPDGGNGSLELLYLAAAGIGIASLVFRKRIRIAIARLARLRAGADR